MWVLFSENVYKNKRIGSHWGAHAGSAPGSANAIAGLVSDVGTFW